jgi:hypothetical protein
MILLNYFIRATVAYYLNPKYFYARKLWKDQGLRKAVFDVYERLYPVDESLPDFSFSHQLLVYRDAQGMLGSRSAIRTRETLMPCK